MRVLIFSDVHANLSALDAVLQDAGEVDQIWCLGDMVGYGPDPNQCIQRVQSLPNFLCLLGNHDVAALGQIDTTAFNADARQAIHWTQDALSSESINYLAKLPLKHEVDDQITLVHGSPRKPIWEYLVNERVATQNFSFFNTQYCFVGHSHLPAIYQLLEGHEYAQLLVPVSNQPISLKPRAIINPGSVGQPRDHNPNASYLILDTDNAIIEYNRTPYDIVSVQQRMEAVGLPERHIIRLEAGR